MVILRTRPVSGMFIVMNFSAGIKELGDCDEMLIKYDYQFYKISAMHDQIISNISSDFVFLNTTNAI